MVKALPTTAPEEVRPPLKVVRMEVEAPRPVTVARVSASVAVIVTVPPEYTALFIPAPDMVRVPPKEMAPEPVFPAKVILELASSVLPISPAGRDTVPGGNSESG